MKQVVLVLYLLLCSLGIQGQETPPITNYTSSNYQAENQNWDITQDDDLFIYAANNEGLLQFNGEEWSLYRSPNQTIPRSVLAHEERIYYGAFMEFGYYHKDGFNSQLTYVSLSDKIANDLLEDENIWHIKEFNGYVLFQSYDRIYFYNPDTETLDFITDNNNYYRLFKTKNKLYVFKRDGSIISLENGKEVEVATFEDKENVQFVLELYEDGDGLILLTRNNGFYKIENGLIMPWDVSVNSNIDDLKIFCGIRLKNRTWVLGTISNGLIFLDESGNQQKTINIRNGLGNNTVLNLFEDKTGNLWAALDNGIDCINLTSFISEFNDFEGIIGTVYASIVYKDNLYLGTNQGLFYKPLYKNQSFDLVSGTEGQVWSLFIYDDDLLCGHTDGTFLIENNTSEKIGKTYGTWGFRAIPKFENTLLLGNYGGMSVLRKVDKKWIDDGMVEGFSNSARFFEILDDLTVYVNHEYKGVFKLVLSEDLSNFTTVEKVGNIEAAKGSGLIRIEDNIYYKNEDGIYSITNDKFKPEEKLSELTPKNSYLSGKLITDYNGRIWSFNQNSIAFSKRSPVNDDFLVQQIPIENSQKKTTVSFENIFQIDEQNLLLGRTDGYLLLNIDALSASTPKLYLNRISIDSLNTEAIEYNDDVSAILKHFQNTIEFKYSVPNYNKFNEVKYQYSLEGLNQQWSKWSGNASVKFEKLQYGDYNFKVRAKLGETISENIETFAFKIKPPFFLSTTAILLYALTFLLVLFSIHRSYKLYYKRINEKTIAENQRQLELERVKNEQKLTKLKNQKLNQEIEAKNREVAISMMSMAKRNEVLKSLKKELEKNKFISEKDPIYSLIKKNSDTDKDWEFFKTAFDQADVDFLKRAKERHPKLTANDLKFCAYLRLNLSSKEIAPLLNISVKSVEVRRYRLRKKLKLEHKESLTDYILSI